MISKEYMPIDIEKSVQDSRDLIMPHQSEAVKAMTYYFQLDRNIPDRAGLVVMPTGNGKTYKAVTWLLKVGEMNDLRSSWTEDLKKALLKLPMGEVYDRVSEICAV